LQPLKISHRWHCTGSAEDEIETNIHHSGFCEMEKS
jgi:hypothetical protein